MSLANVSGDSTTALIAPVLRAWHRAPGGCRTSAEAPPRSAPAARARRRTATRPCRRNASRTGTSKAGGISTPALAAPARPRRSAAAAARSVAHHLEEARLGQAVVAQHRIEASAGRTGHSRRGMRALLNTAWRSAGSGTTMREPLQFLLHRRLGDQLLQRLRLRPAAYCRSGLLPGRQLARSLAPGRAETVAWNAGSLRSSRPPTFADPGLRSRPCGSRRRRPRRRRQAP